jgi:FAD/FMN-containing dehydrogenase
VTIGAGVQVAQLYSAIGLSNQSVVLALAHSVGAGEGYIQGGGHSPMGPWKGMSTDNTVEFEMVTAQVIILVKPRLIYRVKLL